MKRLLFAVFLGAALVAAVPQPGAAADAPRRVLAIHFDTDVNPVTQDWVNHQLSLAANNGYAAAVLVLDTPGGLEESMRKIVARELSLPIFWPLPVIGVDEPMFVSGAIASTSAASEIQTPAEAARAPFGDT